MYIVHMSRISFFTLTIQIFVSPRINLQIPVHDRTLEIKNNFERNYDKMYIFIIFRLNSKLNQVKIPQSQNQVFKKII